MPYIAIAGIIVAAGVAIHNRRQQRIQSEKDRFGNFIQEQIAAIPERHIREFYYRTKPDIKVHVFRVRRFLQENRGIRLDRLWIEYDEIPYEQLDSKHESLIGEAARQAYKMAGSEFQSADEIVRYYLNEFHEFST